VYVVLIHSALLQPRYVLRVRQVKAVLVAAQIALHVSGFLLDSHLVSLLGSLLDNQHRSHLDSPLASPQAPLASPRVSPLVSHLVNLQGSLLDNLRGSRQDSPLASLQAPLANPLGSHQANLLER